MKFASKISFTLLFFSIITVNAQDYNPYYNGIIENVSLSNITDDLNTFVDFGIKQPGTDALDEAKDWIVERYQTLGYTNIEEQDFTVSGQATSNIIVTKTGSVYPNTYLIIDGHYDTVNGVGANDNGSGTVLLLELARLFKDLDTEYSIKFIHFSGEEAGLIGSEFYVNNTVNPQNLDIKLVLNIDEVGGVSGMNNNTIICERDESSPSSNNAASAAATQFMANCYSLYTNLQTEISFAYASDYVPFENNGEVVTGLFEKNESPYTHSPNDIIDNMDIDYVFEVTKGALGAAMHFATVIELLEVSENNLSDGITLYPNPTSGKITINNSAFTTSNVEMTVVDILGKVVLNTSLDKNTTILDLGFLNNGVYMATFNDGVKTLTKKIILK